MRATPSAYNAVMGDESNWNSFARVNASVRYRRQSAAMGTPMTEAIVAEAAVLPGMSVLDLASGTGEPAITIAVRLQGTGRVVGTDISPDPLRIARQRAQDRNLHNMEFLEADAHRLPFPEAEFDRVTCRLGIMFFTDFPAVLRETRRVLKPGGRATLLAWGPFEQPYFQTTLGTILRLNPELQMPASGKAMFRFGEAGTLTSLLTKAGFVEVRERLAEISWNWPGAPEEMWEWFQAVTVPFRPLFDSIPPERRRQVDAEAMAALRTRYRNGEVNFSAQVVLVSGNEPVGRADAHSNR
jgi:ubiquinone/menaquinone biosynthesis C-methylase UbiE